MQNTRKAVFLALLLTVGLLLVPFTAISYASSTTNGTEGKASLVLEETDGPAADVAASHRLIIQLTSPSLAEMSASTGRSRLADGRLDVNSAIAREYIAKLRAEQTTFVSAMRQALPNASVSAYINENGQSVDEMYQVVFNGVAIDPGTTDLASAKHLLSRMSGVKMVYLDRANQPQMYASLQLINAPDLWNNDEIGGRDNAGAGVKVASMDGGVYARPVVTTGTPYAAMFATDGLTYPLGYPLGDTRNTNGKVIVSRVYFRDWDGPGPGENTPWPGRTGTSHGVHTAGTAAGNTVIANYLGYTTTISGVAPRAWVMSYRVFYDSVTNDGSFYNAEGIAALEDIVKDGADVVNNSWGGGPGSSGGQFDALDTALRNAVSAGVFVSMSAGNSGPGQTTTDHPSDDYIISAATTTSGTLASGRMDVSAP
nr:S8 family serine peptidase [Ardenticatenales bacterium]